MKTSRNISAPICRQNINNAIDQFDYLRGTPFADSNDGDHDLAINLLIGVKDMAKFFNGCAIRGEKGDGPTAYCTKLGWVLPSTVAKETSSAVNNVSSLFLQVQVGSGIQRTDDIVHTLWDYESVGIRKQETVHETFVNNIEMEEDKYCVS